MPLMRALYRTANITACSRQPSRGIQFAESLGLVLTDSGLLLILVYPPIFQDILSWISNL